MSIHVMSMVWKRSRQKGGELLVLLALADYANDDGYCWPSIKTLSERSRLLDRSVRRILRKLEKDGEIVTQTKGGVNGSNRYRVTPPSEEIELFDMCALCGAGTGDKGVSLERHHILPRSKGGGELAANKIPVCGPCHGSLHDSRTHDLSERGKILLRDGVEAARSYVSRQEDKMSGGQNELFEPDAEVSQTVKEPSIKPKESRAEDQDIPVDHPHAKNSAFQTAWDEWKAARKARKRPLTPIAAKKQLTFLATMPAEDAVASIDASIRNDWTGLFPPRGSGVAPKERRATFA